MPNHWILSFLLSACISTLIHDGEAGHSFGKFLANSAARTDDDVYRQANNAIDNRQAGISKESSGGQFFYPGSFGSDSWPSQRGSGSTGGSASLSSVYGGSSSDYVEEPGSDIWPPVQSYGGGPDSRILANQYWDNSGSILSKRGGHQLSIVNPLDVLRQNLMLEMARRKMIENQEQIKANEAILKSLGKRNGEKPSGHELLGGTRRDQTNRRKNQRKAYDSAQDLGTGEFDV